MSSRSAASEDARGQRESHEVAPKSVCRRKLSISRWVNEKYPPWSELLSAHDVARLTRRPLWVLAGLCLIGRFPKKLKFRGRGIGWRQSEVLDWMSRDPEMARENEGTPRACARKHPRQSCLPFECATSCVGCKCAAHRPEAKCQKRTPLASHALRR
jgi:hypothetical protein